MVRTEKVLTRSDNITVQGAAGAVAHHTDNLITPFYWVIGGTDENLSSRRSILFGHKSLRMETASYLILYWEEKKLFF